jgi:hypothetical protein
VNARGSSAADRNVAGQDPDLALLTGAVAAAGRVDRDPVPAGGVEHGRAARDPDLGTVGEEPQPDAVGAVVLGRGRGRQVVAL